MKYHIVAWGSEARPDLDYETDERPDGLGWKYPYVHIAALTPIDRRAFDAALADEKAQA